MGMNTAFADAAALIHLLDEFDDDWDAVLSAFSKERVKEGRALTDLSFYLSSMNRTQQAFLFGCGSVRTLLRKIFPSLHPDPQTAIQMGVKLSTVYDIANKIGVLKAVRRTNDEQRLKYEEEQLGLATPDQPSFPFGPLAALSLFAVIWGVLAHY